MTSNKNNKNFISSADLNREELLALLDLASELKAQRKIFKQTSQTNNLSCFLKNKIAGIFTTKPSLRTRISFEVALKELGAETLFIKDDEIGLGTRESYEDVANIISRYLDIFIIRSNSQAGLEKLVQNSSIPVINALTDKEHPCQALADFLTIKELFKLKNNFSDLKLTYIGDGNNVANSLMLTSAILGVNFKAICPKNFEVNNLYFEKACELAKLNNTSLPVISNNTELCQDSDVIYTDVWVSMGQNKNIPSKEFLKYQVNSSILKNKNIPVMHCLPAHKNEEISEEIFNKNTSLIFEQAENRLHAQKALIKIIFN